MGTLRILSTAASEETGERDPYDFLSFDEPRAAPRFISREWMLMATLGMLVSLILAGSATFYLASTDTDDDSLPFAYFEIKVLDADGRPVPGATVHEGDHPIGVTDSFGEWRRFLKVQLGSVIPLKISKKNGKGMTATAIKNMAVPLSLPRQGELELIGSVQLGQLRNLITDKNSTKKPLDLALNAADSENRGSAETNENVSAPRNLKSSQIVESTQLTVSAGSASLPVSTIEEIQFDSLNIVAEPSHDPRFADFLSHLKDRAQQLGLKLSESAPWQLHLRHIATTDEETSGGGLILAESRYHVAGKGERFFSYLRNYQTEMLQTARDVLWALSLQTRKSHRIIFDGYHWVMQPSRVKLWRLAPGRILEDRSGNLHRLIADPRMPDQLVLAASAGSPCDQTKECDLTTAGLNRLPPYWGWRRQKLQLLGPHPQSTDVYVAGFSAQQLSNGQYEFWSPSRGPLNVTIIANGKLLLRERFSLPQRGSLKISLPQPPISMR